MSYHYPELDLVALLNACGEGAIAEARRELGPLPDKISRDDLNESWVTFLQVLALTLQTEEVQLQQDNHSLPPEKHTALQTLRTFLTDDRRHQHQEKVQRYLSELRQKQDNLQELVCFISSAAFSEVFKTTAQSLVKLSHKLTLDEQVVPFSIVLIVNGTLLEVISNLAPNLRSTLKQNDEYGLKVLTHSVVEACDLSRVSTPFELIKVSTRLVSVMEGKRKGKKVMARNILAMITEKVIQAIEVVEAVSQSEQGETWQGGHSKL
jgi:hypothetical protein